ncbi:uncharacterized protein PHACADRAFT_207702 [Phanerochaete carnosa HHB-10118-sp]|uniref:Cytochrome P450 n=1 Tax=Phanerochaete carnosa (strain HHB-10118-sp) TaxID=650164 RepID=K5X142_PHACS|nr:uncharacterized protein PHACADRAFT_207702 [Phanerochaete carnosa HHB-10118-sp]EKM56472.1 hypothetical protein PHACADRAFT_207702 [Phanerochaete carnosa HHB-10118-sp]
MHSTLAILNTSLALIGILLVRALIARSRQRAPYPPGPKGLPVVGNVTEMPTSHEWLKFAEWADKYGNIIHLNLLGQPMVVLNSAKHAIELLDKRSNIYSDRPALMMGGEIVGWKYTLVLTPYGRRFREYRRFIAKLIGGPTQMQTHLPLEEYETRRFLKRILNNPEGVAEHIRKMAGCIILKLSHGYEVREGHDHLIELVDTATEQFSMATSPGAFLVDVFPLLRYVPAWVPGAGFQKKAQEWKRTIKQMADSPHEFVKKRMDEDANIPNYTSELLQNETLEGDKEFNIKWSAASLYSGVPHRLTEDDIYEGYLIPKGSIVIANIWKILHDPKLYANPFVFDPTRFLPEDGHTPATDPRGYCFGFGRRICPGLHLADASVFISCVMVLATFGITKTVENGTVVEPEVEYTSGTISHPKPFKCTIKPRSAKAEALVQFMDEEP